MSLFDNDPLTGLDVNIDDDDDEGEDATAAAPEPESAPVPAASAMAAPPTTLTASSAAAAAEAGAASAVDTAEVGTPPASGGSSPESGSLFDEDPLAELGGATGALHLPPFFRPPIASHQGGCSHSKPLVPVAGGGFGSRMKSRMRASVEGISDGMKEASHRSSSSCKTSTLTVIALSRAMRSCCDFFSYASAKHSMDAKLAQTGVGAKITQAQAQVRRATLSAVLVQRSY